MQRRGETAYACEVRRSIREAAEHELRMAERLRDSHRRVAEAMRRRGRYRAAEEEADRAAHYARRVAQIKAERETRWAST